MIGPKGFKGDVGINGTEGDVGQVGDVGDEGIQGNLKIFVIVADLLHLFYQVKREILVKKETTVKKVPVGQWVQKVIMVTKEILAILVKKECKE